MVDSDLDAQLAFSLTRFIFSNLLPSEERITSNVLRTFTRKPGPESGRDCLMCAQFARERVPGEGRSLDLPA